MSSIGLINETHHEHSSCRPYVGIHLVHKGPSGTQGAIKGTRLTDRVPFEKCATNDIQCNAMADIERMSANSY